MSRSFAVRALRGLLAARSGSGVLSTAARSLTESQSGSRAVFEPPLTAAARSLQQVPSQGFAAASGGGGADSSSGSNSADRRGSAWEEVSKLSAAATEMAEEGRVEEAKGLLKRGEHRAAAAAPSLPAMVVCQYPAPWASSDGSSHTEPPPSACISAAARKARYEGRRRRAWAALLAHPRLGLLAPGCSLPCRVPLQSCPRWLSGTEQRTPR